MDFESSQARASSKDSRDRRGSSKNFRNCLSLLQVYISPFHKMFLDCCQVDTVVNADRRTVASPPLVSKPCCHQSSTTGWRVGRYLKGVIGKAHSGFPRFSPKLK